MASSLPRLLLLCLILSIWCITSQDDPNVKKTEMEENKAYSVEDDEVVDNEQTVGSDPNDQQEPPLPPKLDDIEAIREKMRADRAARRDVDMDDIRRRAEDVMQNRKRDIPGYKGRGAPFDEERERERRERREQRRTERESRRAERRRDRGVPPHERRERDRGGRFDPRDFDANNFDPRKDRPPRPDREGFEGFDPRKGRFDPEDVPFRGRRPRPGRPDRHRRDEL